MGRFSRYLPDVKVKVFYGGVPVPEHKRILKSECPHIIVGTPGRILQLVREKDLVTKNVKHFILDECDKMLEKLDMRGDVQEIFKSTPHEKQVMMFSATLSSEMRTVCKKFMQDPMEIYVDDSKLTLHGLQQHYVKLAENEKNRKLKDFKHRILVSTDIWGRGIDIERVNIVVNYDMPEVSDTYLHRVGRAGRFGTKGLAITFVSNDEDAKTLEDVQSRFEVSITQLPEAIGVSSYMTA